MRVVLYAHDMEPITVIDLSNELVDHMHEHGVVSIPIWDLDPLPVTQATPVAPCLDFKVVHIRPIRAYLHGRRCTFLYTEQESAALLLRSVLLPGQQRQSQEDRQRAFANGVLEAFRMSTKRE